MAKSPFGLADDARDKLARRFLKPPVDDGGARPGAADEALCRFDRHPG